VEDRPGALLDHPAGRGPGGDEVGPQADVDRRQQVVGGHVDERGALDVGPGHQVERHVDAAGRRDDLGDVVVDRLLVEGVEHGHRGRAAVRIDVTRDRVQRIAGAAHERDRRALPGVRPGHGPADPPAGPVDDRRLAFQHTSHRCRPPSRRCVVLTDVQRPVGRKLIAPAMIAAVARSGGGVVWGRGGP
jgi:hypothetical protein